MKILKRTLLFAAITISAFVSVHSVNGQAPGSLTGQANRAEQAAAQAQQQAHAQIQQQLQAQALLQAQAQLQQQVQAQIEQQIQSQIQGQVQQQVQDQVQQQVQSQVQDRAQAQAHNMLDRAQHQAQGMLQSHVEGRLQSQSGGQAQASLQADMARAASLVQPSIVSNQTQFSESAITNIQQGAKVNRERNESASTDLAIQSSTNINAQAAMLAPGANVRSQSNHSARLCADLPVGVTEADVKLYNNIFGNFNPLIETSKLTAQSSANVNANHGATISNIASQNSAREQKSQSENAPVANGHQANANTQGNVNQHSHLRESSSADLTTRISTAVQLRRSEISLLRDEAIEQASQQKMQAAEQMEVVLNAFLEAQTNARVHSQGAVRAHASNPSGELRSASRANLESSTRGRVK